LPHFIFSTFASDFNYLKIAVFWNANGIGRRVSKIRFCVSRERHHCLSESEFDDAENQNRQFLATLAPLPRLFFGSFLLVVKRNERKKGQKKNTYET
jgi:hypothetical protein